jgi:hypothetical protein
MLHRLFTFGREFIRISIDIRTQKKNIQKVLKTRNLFSSSFQDVFNRKEIRKIENYALLTHVAIMQPFSCLIGRKPTPAETKLQILLSLYAAIQDNTIDSEDLMNFSRKNTILQEIVDYLKKNVYQKELFNLYFDKIIKAQRESKKQFNRNISISEIQEISFRKSGYAFLLMRSILSVPLIENEAESIFQYGGVAQIGDDILDLYDDVCQNINTLANRLETHELGILFNAEIFKTIALFKNLNVPEKNKQKALNRILVFLFIFDIGLQNLEKLKINTKDWEQIKNKNRDRFIVDMDRFKYKFSLLKECLKSEFEKTLS